MFDKIKLLYIGIGSLLLAGLISIILNTFRTSMIISVGIVATNNTRKVLVWCFLLIGIGLIIVDLYELARNAISNSSKNKLKKTSLAYRAKTSGQDEIREQLRIMQNERPKLSIDIDGCLEQLDSINRKFDRFDQLIKSNDAEFVSGARVAFVEIEKTLCTNFKWVINSSIAADDDGSSTTDKFYDQCRDRIRRVMIANNRALDKGGQFLLEIADNISQTENGINSTLLDAWLETIRDQNKQSLIGDEKL